MKKVFCLFSFICISTLSFSQAVGIGTTTPAVGSLLHVDVGGNDSKGFLVTGSTSETATVPDLHTGSRLMFYPGKAAFRAGMGIFPHWNNANVGFFSVAMGLGTLASNRASVALGESTKATGTISTAFGYLSTASGSYSTALGYNSLASGLHAFAAGRNSISSSTWSVSFGEETEASGVASTALGRFTVAAGTDAIAAGYQSIANGEKSLAIGMQAISSGYSSKALGSDAKARGSFSSSLGLNTIAKGYGSTVIGMFNDSILTMDQTVNIESNTPLFIIGNGGSPELRSNAVLVEKNGNVAIGNIIPAPSAQLHVDLGVSTTKGVLFTGAFNAASTVPDLGVGTRMMFYPGKAAFRAGRVSSTQWNSANVGPSSVAMGENTIASGSNATALGYQTLANSSFSTAIGAYTSALGILSTAMGMSTVASGANTTAIGAYTFASGDYAISMGYYNKAKGFGSTVIGMYNDSILITNQVSATSSTPLFIIGNGDDANSRSNALLVEKSGNVAIGNITPASSALLHVNTGTGISKGLLVNGTFNEISGTLPDLGAGSRMMFYPGKAAFRVGRVDGAQWNNSNVGHSSVVLGSNSTASGVYSTAIGYLNTAAGLYTTVLGINSTATGFQSLAIGNGNIAKGDQSIAMGSYSKANGSSSATFGFYNRAKGFASTVLGMYNDSILVTDQSNPTDLTPLLIVGNGNSDLNRSNAVVVRKDGNVGFGMNAPSAKVHINSISTVTTPQLLLDENSTGYARLGFKNTLSAYSWNIAGQPNTSNATAVLNFYYEGLGDVLSLKGSGNATLTGVLTQNSDARLKKNILLIGSSLNNLVKLNGYQYKWSNENRDQEEQFGVLAQEVQEVFPGLVKEDEKGILSVNYSGLIPVLINAVKEQQQQITTQQNLIKKMEERLVALEKNK